MARAPLPCTTAGSTLLTDSGIETDISSASVLATSRRVPLLSELHEGRDILERYYREHVAVAAEPPVSDTSSRPLSHPAALAPGTTLGYSQEELDSPLDREGVAGMDRTRAATGWDRRRSAVCSAPWRLRGRRHRLPSWRAPTRAPPDRGLR